MGYEDGGEKATKEEKNTTIKIIKTHQTKVWWDNTTEEKNANSRP